MQHSTPTHRQMIFGLLQLAVIAPVLWRASMKENNPYFKWGLRLTAGAVAFANFGHAGAALTEISRRARPNIPILNIELQNQPPPSVRRVVEGELVD